MMKTSTSIHIRRVPHKTRWNIQILVSYVLAVFACVLTNGGVFVAFYRWDYLWLFVAFVGIFLILVGAMLNLAGSRTISNKNQKRKSADVEHQTLNENPCPPNPSLNSRSSCCQVDGDSNVLVYETLSSNAERRSCMLSSAPLLNVNGQNYLLLSIPKDLSEAETRRLSKRLSTVVQGDLSDILKKSEETSRQKESTVFSSMPDNCQNLSNCNTITKQDNLMDLLITCQVLRPLPENERTSPFVPNVDSVLKENAKHISQNERKCVMTENFTTAREPKIGSLKNNSGTTLYNNKQSVSHRVQELNEDLKRELTIMPTSRHEQTCFTPEVVEERCVDIQCCIGTNVYDSIRPTANDENTNLGKPEHNELAKDCTEETGVSFARNVVYDLPREPRSFHRKEVLPEMAMNNLPVEQSNVLNLQSGETITAKETYNDRCLSKKKC
ncbi:uncharacterized protein LOC143222027 isoform X2 [Tachypleus tridentatus]